MIIKTTVKIKEIEKWLSPHIWGTIEDEKIDYYQVVLTS